MYLFNPETGTVTTIPEDSEYVLAELFPQLEEDDGSPLRSDQGRLPSAN
jgi:hypothetical protein